MGVPIGTDQKAVAQRALDMIRGSAPWYAMLKHNGITPQVMLLILRKCGIPQANHIARILDPAASEAALREHEDMIFKCVQSQYFSDDPAAILPFRDILSMPVKLGGLGLTSL